MIGVYREFEGCMRLVWHVLRCIRVFALPPVTEALTRQIYFTGASATTGMVLRGAFKGAAEARSLIEALGDKPGSRQTQPASAESHAGQ